MTKQERIEKLKKGLESESTPDSAKESMRQLIAELEAPEPEPIPEPIKKPKKKAVEWDSLPHVKYMVENKITLNDLSMPIRKKINGLRLFIGRDTEKIRSKAPEISNELIESIKNHLTPPLPPLKEYSKEENEARSIKFRELRERRKAKITQEED